VSGSLTEIPRFGRIASTKPVSLVFERGWEILFEVSLVISRLFPAFCPGALITKQMIRSTFGKR